MRKAAFTPDDARLILNVVRYLRASGFVIEQPGRGKQFVPPEAPIYIRNDTGEEIPPFACLQTTGTIDSGGQNYVTVDKPIDITGGAGWYLFNGVAPIEEGGFGIAYDGPLVRMLTNGATVTCGDYWQPSIGSFAVVPGGKLFTAVGLDDIETNVMRAFVYKGSGTGRQIQGRLKSLTTPTSGPYTGKPVASILVEVAGCDDGALIGDQVDVVDWSGCVFDLTAEELDDVWVFAAEGVAESQASGAAEGELTPCHWTAIDRCCVPVDGD